MFNAQSSNSLLSYEHPRTDCTYLDHQCIYAAQIKCEELGSIYLHRLTTPRILLLSDLHYNTKAAARNA